MIELMLAKFMFNDVPHAIGLIDNPEEKKNEIIVRINMDQYGKIYEVWTNKNQPDYMTKDSGFRTYDKARKYAEKLALSIGARLIDTIPKEYTEPVSEQEVLTAEEKLRRAVFGIWDK